MSTKRYIMKVIDWEEHELYIPCSSPTGAINWISANKPLYAWLWDKVEHKQVFEYERGVKDVR